MNGTTKTSITRELIFDAFDYIAANLHPADAKEFEMASGHANFRDRLTVWARTRRGLPGLGLP